jgi:thioredoxin 1
MSVEMVSSERLSELKAQSGLLLVDFTASWCGPCKQLAPILDAYAGKHPEVTVVKVDVDLEPGPAAEMGVSSVPTMFLFKDGEPVNRLVGARSLSALEAELAK